MNHDDTAESPPSPGGNLADFGDAVAGTLREFALKLPELPTVDLLNETGRFDDAALMKRIDAMTQTAGEQLRTGALGRLFDRFNDKMHDLKHAIEQRVFDDLIRQVRATRDKGENLIAFLNRAVEPNAVVTVTGHSKGGALAVATALWLAESWAPERDTQIECFSFAGPTPGNQAFAERYNALLASKTRRIVNPRDVVPHAFVPDELLSLSAIYPQLEPALRRLARSVTPLGYTHVGGTLVSTASSKGPPGLVKDLIHQHLDAYFVDAGFTGVWWNARSIFLGD